MIFEAGFILNSIKGTLSLITYTDEIELVHYLSSQKDFGMEVVIAELLYHFSYLIKDTSISLRECFEIVGINYDEKLDLKFSMTRELDSNFELAYLSLTYKVEQFFSPEIRGAQLIRAESVHRGANRIKNDLINDAALIDEILKGSIINTAPIVPSSDNSEDFQRSECLIDTLAKTAIDIQKFVSALNQRKEFYEKKYKYVYHENLDISGLAEQYLFWDRAASWITWQADDEKEMPFN